MTNKTYHQEQIDLLADSLQEGEDKQDPIREEALANVKFFNRFPKDLHNQLHLETDNKGLNSTCEMLIIVGLWIAKIEENLETDNDALSKRLNQLERRQATIGTRLTIRRNQIITIERYQEELAHRFNTMIARINTIERDLRLLGDEE